MRRVRGFEVVKGFEDAEVELPKRSTAGSAGYDFFACEDVIIQPGKIELVPTGVKAYFPPNEVLLLFNRSSIPRKKGLVLANGVGFIDSDYYNNPDNDGHIMFLYWNFDSTDSKVIKKGLVLANGVGVIDSDYYNNPDNDGHIMFQYWNIDSTDSKVIKKGERIGQGIFVPILLTDNDQSTGQRLGGFGSTGE
jgi:dUTP pyrophosphatase